MASLPYMNAYGRIKTALDKIATAATPERFTQKFLAETLGMKGGSALPVIPFLKRVGFLGTDGSPTEIYREFRNEHKRGAAAAKALKHGFSPLFEMNESAFEVTDHVLKGLIVQATGLAENTSSVSAILGSFKAINAFADFKALKTSNPSEPIQPQRDDVADIDAHRHNETGLTSIGLNYTINLSLPATSDITVFNAIFKSLRDNLLANSKE